MSRRLPRRRVLVPQLLAMVFLASGTALLPAATPSDGFHADPDRLVIATAHWRDRADLQRIASRFQHLVVDAKARTARVEASAGDLEAMRRLGIRMEIDGEATERMRNAEGAMARRADFVRQHLTRDGKLTAEGLEATQTAPSTTDAIAGYACYRTVEETYATMNLLAASRPTLASVVDIGPSWTWARTGGAQGYRMRVLRLGNTATDASIPNKPDMVVVAALHAREYTTAELVTRFGEWLVDGYGSNAEATWLLDNFRFHLILQANPDGRKKAESGLSWRKNTDNDDGSCSANAYGVDLNRNFTWRFGTVDGGSSSDPCAVNYRGPSAASEEEVQNILRYAIGTRQSDGSFSGGVLQDRRTDTGTAPVDYRGLLLDIHSFSQLVLWPWAYTSTASPNAAQLRTFGRRMAYFNGYRPVQWNGLYLADGTITDTVYGNTGAPSYTIELGQEFFEDCSTFESSTLPRNFEALKYAARNLHDPYISPSGPDVTSTGASAAAIAPGQAFAVSAWIDDARFNQSNGTEAVHVIASARATLDAPPWSSASSLTMRASDGVFDSSREQVVVNIDTRGLAPGRHVVYVRGTDASGVSGTPSAIYFTVRAPQVRHDYDGDRRADLFWRNAGTGQNSIWRAANSSTWTSVSPVTAAGWQFVATGDFNGDGRADVFWRNASTGANAVWRSANSATPQATRAVTDTGWRVTGAGDFDGDGRADVFWRHASTGANAIWRAADGSTPQAVARVSDVNWRVMGIGDFDGDGRADVLWRHATSGANAIWRSADPRTQMPITGVTDTGWRIAGVGDFNNDGKDDIFWRHATTGQNTIWRSAVASTKQGVNTVATSWNLARIADFDGDGGADLLWRNPSTGQNVIWKRASPVGNQSLTSATSAWAVVPSEPQP
jgi:carboxypeptidase T